MSKVQACSPHAVAKCCLTTSPASGSGDGDYDGDGMVATDADSIIQMLRHTAAHHKSCQPWSPIPLHLHGADPKLLYSLWASSWAPVATGWPFVSHALRWDIVSIAFSCHGGETGFKDRRPNHKVKQRKSIHAISLNPCSINKDRTQKNGPNKTSIEPTKGYLRSAIIIHDCMLKAFTKT